MIPFLCLQTKLKKIRNDENDTQNTFVDPVSPR